MRRGFSCLLLLLLLLTQAILPSLAPTPSWLSRAKATWPAGTASGNVFCSAPGNCYNSGTTSKISSRDNFRRSVR